MIKRILVLVLLAVLFAACGSTQTPVMVRPTPAPSATVVPTPTATVDPSTLQQPAPNPPVPTPTPTPPPTALPSPVRVPPTTTPTPFTVLSVDLAVSPDSRTNMACGSTQTFTYTATFHVSGSGLVKFNYTTTNGREIMAGSLNFMSGATVEAFTFTATGTVTLDETFPGTAGVFVTSPNEVRSPVIIVSGTCSPSN